MNTNIHIHRGVVYSYSYLSASPKRDHYHREIHLNLKSLSKLVHRLVLLYGVTRWQGVKRKRIGIVQESRASSASSPEPPELQPLEELITQATQAEQAERSQAKASLELREISAE
jgi:hypothetical protein